MSDLTRIIVPKDSPNTQNIILVSWQANNGQPVSQGQEIAILDAAKTSLAVESPKDGYLYFTCEAGSRLEAGDLLALVSTTKMDLKEIEGEFSKISTQPPSQDTPHFSQKALKLIKKHKIPLDQFTSIDSVNEESVLKFLASPSSDQLDYHLRPQPIIKRQENLFLTEFQHSAVTSSLTRPIALNSLKERINTYNDLSPTPTSLSEIVSFATIQCLKSYKNLNSFYFNEQTIAQYHAVRFGYAVDFEGHGLKVATLPKAEDLTLSEFIVRMKQLLMSYRRDELRPEEVLPATFTVTNMSNLNITDFTPVLPPNTSCILAICAPSYDSQYFNVIATFDHRVTAGHEVARYLNELNDFLLDSDWQTGP